MVAEIERRRRDIPSLPARRRQRASLRATPYLGRAVSARVPSRRERPRVSRRPALPGLRVTEPVQARPAQQSATSARIGEPAGRQIPLSFARAAPRIDDEQCDDRRVTRGAASALASFSRTRAERGVRGVDAGGFVRFAPRLDRVAKARVQRRACLERRAHLGEPARDGGSSDAALAPAARTMVSATALTDRMIEVCIFVSSCAAR